MTNAQFLAVNKTTIEATARRILNVVTSLGFASDEIFDGKSYPLNVDAENHLLESGLVVATTGLDAFGDLVEGLAPAVR